MINNLFRSSGLWVLPVAVLFSALFGLPAMWNSSHISEAVLQLVPVTLVFFGLVLCWRFSHSRAFHGLLILLGVLAMGYFAPHWMQARVDVQVSTLSILYLLSIFRDRSIFSHAGLVQLTLIQGVLLLVFAGFWMWPALNSLFAAIWVNLPFFNAINLNQPILLMAIVLMLTLGVRLLYSKRLYDSGLLAMNVSILFMLHHIAEPGYLFAWASTGALVMVITLIQESYRMAFMDELTGLPGRRALNNRLHQLGSVYSVAMVDVDHFKKFNDTYGHDVGDQVLRMVASKLNEVGGGGATYRYGGEEFTVLFPGKDAKQVKPHLERIREKVEQASFSIRSGNRRKKKRTLLPRQKQTGKKVSVTVSIGLSRASNRQVKPQQVVKSADKALYRAKQRGRNRVCT